MKKVFILFLGIISLSTNAKYADVGPRIDGFLQRVEPLKIKEVSKSVDYLNLLGTANCFIETHDNNILDQRVNFTVDDIDHNGKLVIESSSRSFEASFMNNENGGLDIKISSGRKRGARSYVDLSIKSLDGLHIRLDGGSHGNLLTGHRKLHFRCQ
ncbi:hypothetical protein [Bacteriovorax sp. Seq25_V]|uniref:hypothetical protein n=1 Tax=Bacteriovorax sp. Seq25_V TaxID=1201288 RepID=UPI00038A462A|nr:hypothetical protein [Bacteriovorax sp. Seq25_V]EQC47699.1 hypothetical protein M900_A0178 [Bacteriovorax sp. Seq25_V]